MPSRRQFLTGSAVAIVAAFPLSEQLRGDELASDLSCTKLISLCGEWSFLPDPANLGTSQHWHLSDLPAQDRYTVSVPHTWQIQSQLAEFYGVAWYRRAFDAPLEWQSSAVRLEFEAVFHTATVWVNGQLAGEHIGKGYTAFIFDITQFLRWGTSNVITVRVDNAFNNHMLPRGQSSDWAHDGGIFRPVQLLITPELFVERVEVEAVPDLHDGSAKIIVNGFIRNTGQTNWNGSASYRIVDDASGQIVSSGSVGQHLSIQPGALQTQTAHLVLPNAKLWHFDHPSLYRLDFSIHGTGQTHSISELFGIRKLEVKDGTFYFNGERVHLMGVERMAGSNPQFGMAEPEEWIRHDHADLKNLNCVFTRVHWPQDKRVLDYCDRHGILMQTEVPTWGSDTFQGMAAQPDSDIMKNGLEQLREMITRDRNHPSLVVWGLCNEIGGQDPAAYEFAKNMLHEAKKLDPARLCSYASHSLQTTPARDVAGLMDFIEVNEYYGTWQPGSAADAARNLDEIHAAFPDKPIVISEYGYCACTLDRPEGDEHRIEILRTHDAALRSKPFVSGAIFFCYNDYRTHIGDRGTGPLKQRVHGVVDVYGRRKPSYDLLRSESSPIESLTAENRAGAFHIALRTRGDVPLYTLRGYKLRGVFYGQGAIPVERQEVEIQDLLPSASAEFVLKFQQPGSPIAIRFDVVRPTGFSAFSLDWKP